MRYAYAAMGLGFAIIIGGVIFFSPETTHAPTNTMEMTLTSPAFEHEGRLPEKFSCDGEGVSPELQIANVPEGAKTLVLLMDDPDVPKALRDDGMFDHWVLFNIPPETTVIPEGESVGTAGSTTRGTTEFVPACPPPQFEPSEHRYIFQLYALDTELALSEGATKEAVKTAMKGHILAKSELIGRYSRD